MDNWRQDKYSAVSKALQRVERRTDKLEQRLHNGSSSANLSPQRTKKIAVWADDVARLRDMRDRLSDFRSRLYFYSNLDYVEALTEWENEVEKLCKRARSLAYPSSGGNASGGNASGGDAPRQRAR